jgi:hypothetical protein
MLPLANAHATHASVDHSRATSAFRVVLDYSPDALTSVGLEAVHGEPWGG